MRWLALAAVAAAFSGGSGPVTIAPQPYHRIAGIGLDRDWLVLAEDPAGAPCPVVELLRLPDGSRRQLTRPSGPSCTLGSRFSGARPIANALQSALWIVQRRDTAAAVESKPRRPETAILVKREITLQRGPFLGPVVGTNWLILFGDVTRGLDGKLVGGAVSGNNRELWASDGTPVPVGLDDQEHAVSIGADGSIAMWQAHGARYGRVPDAHALTAAVENGVVYVLRKDTPRLDVRTLAGKFVRSWPVAAPAVSPCLDVAGTTVVYCSGRAVHELDARSGRDRVVARTAAPIVDAQIEAHWLVYATASRVVALPR